MLHVDCFQLSSFDRETVNGLYDMLKAIETSTSVCILYSLKPREYVHLALLLFQKDLVNQ